MVDSGSTNSFVHNQVVQHLNTTTVDIPAMRVTMAIHILIVILMFFFISSSVEIYYQVPLEYWKLHM